MELVIEAVIFDMDGVLINSEHLWRKAMIKGFAEFGMLLTEADCRQTMGMRFDEVIVLWLTRFALTLDPKKINDRVLDLLIDLIENEGCVLDGIPETLEICRKARLRTGLATSSSVRLMNAVLKKLDLQTSLEVTVSAEGMNFGKPHPEVFLVCAEKLGVDPANCLVIEDSLNGVIAAKAARMQVVAVPEDGNAHSSQFTIADHQLADMKELPHLLERLLKG